MNELIKKIPDFENYYADIFGNIYSTHYWRGRNIRLIKPIINVNGYAVLMLYKNKKYTHYRIHRLIAKTFLDLADNLCVDHINGSRTDNRLENLRICTKTENNRFNNRKRFSKTGEVNISINQCGNYHVSISRNYIGTYKTLDEAIEARDKNLHVLSKEEVAKALKGGG